ncbi:MAG TPA: N-acetylmuramoyl-L-alanine amidase [Steroidobacteraceae bacterium]|nr:N-acetylmuramoyl-L-alanine amidase [Steroidobacteraceae bacterium]
MRIFLLRLAGSALLAMCLAVPAAAVEVRDIRLWAGPDSTRVVFDLSGSVRHRLSTLKSPARIVLDMPGARTRPGGFAAPAAAGAVKQVRLAQRAGGNLRIVIDLSHPVRANSFLTAPNDRYGYRLVVDLAGAAAPPPAPAVGPSVPVKVEHAPPEARDLIIAIDAGHGGDDPGAIGISGTREKDVVFAIAKELAQRVNGETGMRAILTRTGDYFVPLRERMQRARAQQADLFVSIHADSIVDRRVDGSSVYILSQRGASDEAARWLAERENASDLIGGVSLDDKDDVLASVLLDLSQSAALSASETAAEQVLRELNQVGEVRKHQVQQARFMVLKSPDIPSMLVETAYISNPQEELRLRTQAQQSKLAAAIHQGLRAYFYANPPAGTRIAQLAALTSAPRTVLASATTSETAR